MTNPSELQLLGQQLSEDFVLRKIPLTESLCKVAEERGLNKQQVYRVAETANVETYLKLIKTASDRYLVFPVADPFEVFSRREKNKIETLEKKSEVDDSDYESDPEIIVDGPITFFPITAADEEPQPQSPAKLEKEAQRIRGEEIYYTNRLDEEISDFQLKTQRLYTHIKQAALQGATFDIIKDTIKTSSNLIDISDLCDECHEKLASQISHLDTIAKYPIDVQIEQSIKDATTLVEDCAIKVAVLIEQLEQMKKEASVPKFTMNLLKSFVTSIRKHPKFTALIAGAGLLGYPAGKTVGKQEQGEILQKAMLSKRDEFLKK